jgi:hypothetical protein
MLIRCFVRRLLAATLLASPAWSDVLYVDASGQGDFTSIQAAVDSATDGDLLLVRTGTYGPFTVDDKSLWIRADAGAQVQVDGRVVLRDLAAESEIVLAGMELTGKELPIAPIEALRVENCLGDVRVEGCTLTGGNANPTNCTPVQNGGHGLRVVLSGSVVLVDCSLRGGYGQGDGDPNPCASGTGGNGAVFEAASAWLFDCTVLGGAGGDNYHQAGDGGQGLVAAVGSRVFLSGGWVQGGEGGFGIETLDGWPGNGGDGALLAPNSMLEHVDCELLGGLPGDSTTIGLGDPGAPTSGTGTFVALPGAARSLVGAGLVPAFAPTTVQYTGEAGDKVWLLVGRSADLHETPGAIGDWLVQFPVHLTKSPHVVLGATTTATLQVPAVKLPAGVLSGGLHVQALVEDSNGQLRFSGVLPMRAIDCAGPLPDCDGNGEADTCELLAGAPDCDLDGIPDACEPDCNGNGQADDCDIAAGLSEDLNSNQIPDECEGPGTVWHVDDDAPPGGNGSSGAPFQTLAQAFEVAVSTHVIELADGTYTGAQNRDLDFAGRDLTVRSANGAGSCVIDLQFSGRAFELVSGETAVIEGLTVLDGSAGAGGAIHGLNVDLTVRASRFLNCAAAVRGGAISTAPNFAGGGTIRVADSLFVNCSAPSGGAISAVWVSAELERCSFVGNHAQSAGGAVNVDLDDGNSRIVACEFLGNVSDHEGGAIRCATQQSNLLLEVSDCLLAGNRANYGGALFGFGRMELRNSTCAANTANIRGGALLAAPNANLRVANCVLWDNASPAGAALAMSVPSAGATATVTVIHSDVQGGQAGVWLGTGSALFWLGGNLDVNPLFVDADGPDGNPLTLGDNDWRLAAGSPALDAGANAEVPADLLDLDGDGNLLEPLPFDLDLEARFVDDPAPDTGVGTAPLVDMGAYER